MKHIQFLVFLFYLAFAVAPNPFKDVGKTKGLQVWRIRKKQEPIPVVLEEVPASCFLKDATCIMLEIGEKGNTASLYYWIGRDSDAESRMEIITHVVYILLALPYGYKLDRIRMAREMDGNETEDFRSLFPYYEGKRSKYQPKQRLYKIRGDAEDHNAVYEVPVDLQYVTKYGAYLLDTGSHVLLYTAEKANEFEQDLAKTLVMHDELFKSEGKEVLIASETGLDAKGFASMISGKDHFQYDSDEQESLDEFIQRKWSGTLLEKHTTNSYDIINPPFNKNIIDETACYVLDNSVLKEQFIYIGKDAHRHLVDNVLKSVEAEMRKNYEISIVQINNRPSAFEMFFIN